MKYSMKRRTTPTTSKTDTHGILVRVPVDLHERLKEQAERNRRSVNSEVLTLIERDLEAAA